jgi:hypothetical protein
MLEQVAFALVFGFFLVVTVRIISWRLAATGTARAWVRIRRF